MRSLSVYGQYLQYIRRYFRGIQAWQYVLPGAHKSSCPKNSLARRAQSSPFGRALTFTAATEPRTTNDTACSRYCLLSIDGRFKEILREVPERKTFASDQCRSSGSL